MIIKRHGQVVLQTWHGTALKRIGIDSVGQSDHSKFEKMIRPDVKKTGNKNTDIFISGSKFMSDVYHRALGYSKEISLTGTPRTDLFFHKHEDIDNKVRCFYHLGNDVKVILYAPTFRPGGTFEYYDIDLPQIRDYYSKKDDCNYVVIVRLHPNLASKEKELNNLFSFDFINATYYPNMQELLYASDILVTDYSSVMFEFMLSYKPIILYVPDKETYNRGFYFDVDNLPFIIIDNNKDIRKKLSMFDDMTYRNAIISFCSQLGFVEDGHATERVYNLLMSK